MSQSTAKNKTQPNAEVVHSGKAQPAGEMKDLSQTRDGRLRVDISEETAQAMLLELKRIRTGLQMLMDFPLDEIL